MLIGLIGKANVGKSTFFNAATELEVQTANYPFTTINSNVGMAHTRVKCVCKEFQVQDNPIHSVCIEGTRFIPIRLIDVPGLAEGAHQGKGLGKCRHHCRPLLQKRRVTKRLFGAICHLGTRKNKPQ